MKKVSVLHIIDSLNSGGAERMAVNLVNGLVQSEYLPHLCVTRSYGLLNANLDPAVKLICLQRRFRYDVYGLMKIIRYVRGNQIKILHAHGTSIFLALLARQFLNNVSVIWHNHLGFDPNHVPFLTKVLYYLASHYSNNVICVSQKLKNWVCDDLGAPVSRVWLLPNFVSYNQLDLNRSSTILLGMGNPLVVNVANLRMQKDHITLLSAWKLVLKSFPFAHLILIGGVGEQNYAQSVFELLKEKELNGRVTWLGERSDISELLMQCQIGVLSSYSEGFPVALLEYGVAKLGVVATNVGQCNEILDYGRAGLLVPPGDIDALAGALLRLLHDASLRQDLGAHLYEHVSRSYAMDAVLHQLFHIYTESTKD